MCVKFAAPHFVSFIPPKYSSSRLHLLLSRNATSSCANNEPGGHPASILADGLLDTAI